MDFVYFIIVFCFLFNTFYPHLIKFFNQILSIEELDPAYRPLVGLQKPTRAREHLRKGPQAGNISRCTPIPVHLQIRALEFQIRTVFKACLYLQSPLLPLSTRFTVWLSAQRRACHHESFHHFCRLHRLRFGHQSF